MTVLGIGKSRFYDQPTKLAARDEIAKAELRAVHADHPFYGVARLTLHLGWGENKTRRIRTIAEVVVPTASKKYKYPRISPAEIGAPPNILHRYAKFKDLSKPQAGMNYLGMTSPAASAWAQDFTFIKHKASFYYLAVSCTLVAVWL